MYQRARKLCGLITDTITFFSLAEAQLESYMIAMNALSLLDQKNAWIVMPVSHENSHEVCGPVSRSFSFSHNVIIAS